MRKIFDLSHFSLIEISGYDTRDFIHNQITADLELLNQRDWLFSAWCLPNGRVICTFLLFEMNQNLYLLLPSMLSDKVIKRLSMFILRAKVSIRDVSEDFSIAGIVDDAAGEKIENLKDQSSIKILPLRNENRFILIAANDQNETLYEKFTKGFQEGTRGEWSLLDIEAGIPWITFNSSEQYLPQMLNLDDTDGLSYKKGCFPGQEIIARLHYRGEVKKHLYKGTIESETTPGIGDRICIKSSQTVIGEILDAEPETENRYRFLAVCDNSAESLNDLTLVDTDCQTLTIQSITEGNI